MMDFYFESAAMILTLITVGKMLEARSKGKTTDALKSADEARAQNGATVVRGGKEVAVPVGAGAVLGDTFLVRPGESIPVDGVVLDGTAQSTKRHLPARASPPTRLPAIPFPPRPSTSRAF